MRLSYHGDFQREQWIKMGILPVKTTTNRTNLRLIVAIRLRTWTLLTFDHPV